MGERGVRNAEVEGSNPLPSTINRYCRKSTMLARLHRHGLAAETPLMSRRMRAVEVDQAFAVAGRAGQAL